MYTIRVCILSDDNLLFVFVAAGACASVSQAVVLIPNSHQLYEQRIV